MSTPDLRNSPRSLSARAEFVERLGRAARDAAESASLRELWLRLGGRIVCLRFAGDALMTPVGRALAHRQVEPDGEADLTVWLWDDVSTETRMPAPPWGQDAYLARGMIRGFFGDGVFAVFEGFTNALTVLDCAGRQGFFWIRDAGKLPLQAAPLCTLFNLWFAELEQMMVHAAAVGDETGCVLIVGPGGSGKSWTALACVQNGLGYVGDDYCILAAGRPPFVCSLYSSARLWPDAWGSLDSAPPATSGPRPADEGKPLLYLYETAPEAVLGGGPLRAVVIPRIGADGLGIRPATPAAALAAAAPSTLLQLPGGGQSSIRMLASALRSAPCFFLGLGTDAASAARSIREVLG